MYYNYNNIYRFCVRKSNQSQKQTFNEPSTNTYNETSSGYQNDIINPTIKDEKEAYFARRQYENMTRPE